MGMAANQARLMTITARKSDLELRAQQVSAAKMRFAQASSSAAMEYSNALNQTGMKTVTTMVEKKIQTPIYGQMAGTELQTWLTTSNYVLYNGTNESSAVGTLTPSQIEGLLASGYKAANKTTATVGGTYNLDGVNKMQIANTIALLFGGGHNYWTGQLDTVNPIGKSGDNYYLNFAKGSEPERVYGGLTTIYAWNNRGINGFNPLTDRTDGKQHDGTYPASQIIAALESQGISVPQVGGSTSSTYSYVTIPQVVVGNKEEIIMVPVTTTIQGDPAAIKLAQAKYDSFITDISAQEKLLDMELTQVNTEHDAIKTEYDAIKTLIKDNTEKSFNVFG